MVDNSGTLQQQPNNADDEGMALPDGGSVGANISARGAVLQLQSPRVCNCMLDMHRSLRRQRKGASA